VAKNLCGFAVPLGLAGISPPFHAIPAALAAIGCGHALRQVVSIFAFLEIETFIKVNIFLPS
jgi:hypothetical protein